MSRRMASRVRGMDRLSLAMATDVAPLAQGNALRQTTSPIDRDSPAGGAMDDRTTIDRTRN